MRYVEDIITFGLLLALGTLLIFYSEEILTTLRVTS